MVSDEQAVQGCDATGDATGKKVGIINSQKFLKSIRDLGYTIKTQVLIWPY